MKEYKIPERNYNNVQFGTIREKVDPAYNKAHDELSKAFYEKKPFRDMGILDKETFDKLHGLIDMKRQLEFVKAHIGESKIDPTLKEHGIDVTEVSRQIEEMTKEVDIMIIKK